MSNYSFDLIKKIKVELPKLWLQYKMQYQYYLLSLFELKWLEYFLWNVCYLMENFMFVVLREIRW